TKGASASRCSSPASTATTASSKAWRRFRSAVSWATPSPSTCGSTRPEAGATAMNSLLFKLLVQRIGLACLSLLAVSVLVFAITGVLPGDAAQEQLGQEATPESLAALRAQMGLDVPAHQRYLHWLGGLVRGDLGISSTTQLPVAELIASRLPNSLLLAAVTALFSVPVALTL